MKLTQTQLKKMILQEVRGFLKEQYTPNRALDWKEGTFLEISMYDDYETGVEEIKPNDFKVKSDRPSSFEPYRLLVQIVKINERPEENY